MVCTEDGKEKAVSKSPKQTAPQARLKTLFDELG
jgi:hypothetical protein